MASPIRDFRPDDLDWTHALNEGHAVELSSLSRADFAAHVAKARVALVVEDQAAFLLAYDQHADYDSPNFLWFRERLPQFLYVDRVVVSPSHRRKGLAKDLYDRLFAVARAQGQRRIVCEVNADPPNPASDAFHEALGFEVMGRAELEERGKTVTYLRRSLPDPDRALSCGRAP